MVVGKVLKFQSWSAIGGVDEIACYIGDRVQGRDSHDGISHGIIIGFDVNESCRLNIRWDDGNVQKGINSNQLAYIGF